MAPLRQISQYFSQTGTAILGNSSQNAIMIPISAAIGNKRVKNKQITQASYLPFEVNTAIQIKEQPKAPAIMHIALNIESKSKQGQAKSSNMAMKNSSSSNILRNHFQPIWHLGLRYSPTIAVATVIMTLFNMWQRWFRHYTYWRSCRQYQWCRQYRWGYWRKIYNRYETPILIMIPKMSICPYLPTNIAELLTTSTSHVVAYLIHSNSLPNKVLE